MSTENEDRPIEAAKVTETQQEVYEDTPEAIAKRRQATLSKQAEETRAQTTATSNKTEETK
jgi:hypothetical protein